MKQSPLRISNATIAFHYNPKEPIFTYHNPKLANMHHIRQSKDPISFPRKPKLYSSKIAQIETNRIEPLLFPAWVSGSYIKPRVFLRCESAILSSTNSNISTSGIPLTKTKTINEKFMSSTLKSKCDNFLKSAYNYCFSPSTLLVKLRKHTGFQRKAKSQMRLGTQSGNVKANAKKLEIVENNDILLNAKRE